MPTWPIAILVRITTSGQQRDTLQSALGRCQASVVVALWAILRSQTRSQSYISSNQQKDATVDLQKDAQALGLKSPVATPAAVRAAYLRKAKASHPDAGGTKQEFQTVQAAYERLGTQRTRQAD